MFMNQLPYWGQIPAPNGYFGNPAMQGFGAMPTAFASGGSQGLVGPDQDINQFPPWIWPYIRPQALAEQLTQILYGLVIQKHLGALYADQRAGAQVIRSAEMTEDFVCGTVPRIPWPRPHHGIEYVDTLAWQLTLNNLTTLASQYAEGSLKSDLDKLVGSLGKQLKHAEKQAQPV